MNLKISDCNKCLHHIVQPCEKRERYIKKVNKALEEMRHLKIEYSTLFCDDFFDYNIDISQ